MITESKMTYMIEGETITHTLLFVRNYNMTDDQLALLTQEIYDSPSLRELTLDLNHNHFTSYGMRDLFAAIGTLSQLKTIEIHAS